VVLAVKPEKRKMGGSKLLNHRSDFQRNSIIRLGCEKGGIGSKAGEEKERVAVNSLIISVREIVLSDLGASMGTPSLMAILNGLGQLAATCP